MRAIVVRMLVLVLLAYAGSAATAQNATADYDCRTYLAASKESQDTGANCQAYHELYAEKSVPAKQAGDAPEGQGGEPAVDLVLGADPAAFHHPIVWNEGDSPRTVLAGSTFPVSMVTAIDAKSVGVGDPVDAKLECDLKVRGVTVASRGSLISGHVVKVEQARNVLKSEFSAHRWFHPAAVIVVEFTDLLNDRGETVPISASPAPGSVVLSAVGRNVLLVVDKQGELTGAMSPTVKGDAVCLAITGACLPAGPFGLAIAPVANAIVGAVKPEYEIKRALQPDELHPRLKGFAEGLVNGLPGAFIVSGAVRKGDSVYVQPGYQVLLKLDADFTPAPSGRQSASRPDYPVGR